MFLLSRPSDERIRRFIASQHAQPFSYADAGSFAAPAPRGYKTDHNRMLLGKGARTFERARDAITRWEMFNIGWVMLCWPDAPIAVGSTVAVLADHFGFWSLNACRIASIIQENGNRRAYGFIYGTLRDHAECGQEQFTVEWRHEDDTVWYDILAYSRPNQMLATVGYPFTRFLQKRFARESMEAMLRSIASC